MFLKLNPQMPDQEGIDARRLGHALFGTRSPITRIQAGPGRTLNIAFLSGKQLEEFSAKLREMSSERDALRAGPTLTKALAELEKCSGLFVVDQTHQVILVSSRSPVKFRKLEQLFSTLTEAWEDFCDEYSRFTSDVDEMGN